MLILSRRLGESIVIGDDIHITILGVNGNQVRIGIDAPKNVAVHREEIYQRISEKVQVARPRQASNSNHLRSRAKTRSYSSTPVR